LGFECYSVTVDGNKDYTPEKLDIVGGFITTGDVTATSFWSSTEHSSDAAWAKFSEDLSQY